MVGAGSESGEEGDGEREEEVEREEEEGGEVGCGLRGEPRVDEIVRWQVSLAAGCAGTARCAVVLQTIRV